MTASKRLFVLRHAKSSWDDPGLDDHERPLAPRGRRAAALLAEHIRANQIEPDQVLCSSARRTRETLESIGAGGQHVIERELYGASTDEVLARLRRVPDEVAELMLIGHNPTMQTLVLRLASAASAADGSALSEVRAKFPTGALATLTFEGTWSGLDADCAQLAGFVRPKALNQR